MYRRLIEKELLAWKENTHRKPLILRGARQVGKTTVINEFSRHYTQYVYMNLENSSIAQIFMQYSDIHKLVEAIFFLNNKNIDIKDTLIFIDEIQEVPEAINSLRYFYEEYPHLHVIAAGSLLETLLRKPLNIPVGRVEYRVLRPVSFLEYLDAAGEISALQQLKIVPPNDYAHEKLMKLFHTYVLIGGMPEIIAHYIENKNLVALSSIYESLSVSYINDVEKYARNESSVQIMRHVITSMYSLVGTRIKFHGFGQSNYGSREVGEALRTIEKAMLLQLIYPTTNTSLPIISDKRKSPRLQILDTGLMNHFAGLQKEIFGTKDLDKIYQGRVVEHIVGQELLSLKFNVLNELHFWTREKSGSSAEVDFVLNIDGLIIPIEVKSGATGTLRSLFIFMDDAPHNIAVRLYAGKYNIQNIKTLTGKSFYLINIPYYMVSQIENIVTLFLKNNQ
ncbi:AAA family ATPase [Odoribacter sp. OttesenSCG-928-L07]|nr:AAA family ATPase [Odoribacter sp. OttesenSCG-928-L07]MDL2238772.1 AAA family ATPase [Bacteroidales bacterium OttesenSCG-928-L14]